MRDCAWLSSRQRQCQGRVESPVVAQDIGLTIRLLIRRYVLFGGAFKLGMLPATARPELAEEARVASLVDKGISKLFVDNRWSEEQR